MKLCFIANPNSFHTRRWLSYFGDRGHDIHLIVTKPLKSPFPGVSFHDLTPWLKVPKLRSLVLIPALRQKIRLLQPDLLHAHQVTYYGWFGWIAAYHPFVVTPWGSDLHRNAKDSWLAHILAQQVLGMADLVTADSLDLLDEAVSLGANPARCEFIHWGVDLTTFFPAGNKVEIRAKFGITGSPVILSARGMTPLYRHNIIIESIPSVLKVFPEAKFVFRDYNAEPSDYAGQLKKQAQKLGVVDAVCFIGPVEQYQDVIDIYRLADAVVSIPVNDSAGISVFEAMACGVPVIVGEVPSWHEWLTDGQDGLFVQGNDAEEVGQAIVHLLSDRELYQSIRAQALRLVEERASHTSFMAKVEKLYERLVCNRGNSKKGRF